jgi:membrane-associated phospholipid phosphatase
MSLANAWRWIGQHRWVAFATLAAGVGLRLFAELADELYEGQLTPVDLAIQELVRAHHATVLDHLARGLSALMVWPYVALLIAPFLAYLVLTRRYAWACGLILVPGCTVIITEGLKLIFGRPRPLTAIVEEIGNSFPSSHATTATVLYGLLGCVAYRYWLRRRWPRILAVLVTCLLVIATGLARIYLEVHYPSDVAAGWAAGAFILVAGILLIDVWQQRSGRAHESA